MANYFHFKNDLSFDVDMYVKEYGTKIDLPAKGSANWEPKEQDRGFSFEYWKRDTRQFLIGVWEFKVKQRQYLLTLKQSEPEFYYVLVERWPDKE